MAKQALILGAGPGLGLATARRLGGAGYAVHLLTRSAERLDKAVADLRGDGIDATPHIGDISAHAELTELLRSINGETPLDVCLFQPGVGPKDLVDVLDLTVSTFRPDIEMLPLGAAAVGEALVPAMRSRGTGSFVMVGGGAARLALRAFGNHGPAAAALRSYALTLAGALEGDGVHAAFVAIAGTIGEGDGLIGADRIAERLGRLVEERDVKELIITVDGEVVPKGGR